jgi:tetratricopeptide (TPR) repeat protein
LLEKVFSVDTKKIDPIFHVAKLREQQNQLATAKGIYLAVLDSLGPKHLVSDSTEGAQDLREAGRDTGTGDKRMRGAERVWTGKLVPPASRHVKGITESMCRPVPANAVANQLKGEAFFRLAVIILDDPTVKEAEKVKVEVAIWCLRVSLKIDGTQRDAHFKLGMLLLRVQEFSDAIACFGAVTKIAPGWAQAWNNLGVAQDRAGHSQEAVQSFKEAIKITPSLHCARCNTCMISLRALLNRDPEPVELKEIIDDLTEVIESGAAGGGKSFPHADTELQRDRQTGRKAGTEKERGKSFAFGLRGLAYQLRNETKRGVRDADLAIQNYLDALDSDADNLQVRNRVKNSMDT